MLYRLIVLPLRSPTLPHTMFPTMAASPQQPPMRLGLPSSPPLPRPRVAAVLSSASIRAMARRAQLWPCTSSHHSVSVVVPRSVVLCEPELGHRCCRRTSLPLPHRCVHGGCSTSPTRSCCCRPRVRSEPLMPHAPPRDSIAAGEPLHRPVDCFPCRALLLREKVRRCK